MIVSAMPSAAVTCLPRSLWMAAATAPSLFLHLWVLPAVMSWWKRPWKLWTACSEYKKFTHTKVCVNFLSKIYPLGKAPEIFPDLILIFHQKKQDRFCKGCVFIQLPGELFQVRNVKEVVDHLIALAVVAL